jgi:hypothetical protein
VSAYFHKRGKYLAPSEEAAEVGLSRMGDGECVLVSIIRPRSVNWHRKYFGICQSIAENQDPPRDKDSVDYELRILAGHYDVIFVNGKEVWYPKRIAFDKLSAEAWGALWPSLELAIVNRFGVEYIAELA